MTKEEMEKMFCAGKKMKYAEFKKAVAEKAGISVSRFDKEIRNGYKTYTTASYFKTYPLEYFNGREGYLAGIIEELINYEAEQLKDHLEEQKNGAEA